MARPRRDAPLDQFTTADLAVGTGLTSQNIIALSNHGLIPGFDKVGMGAHRIGTFQTLQHTAMIGALRSAGFEPVLAGKIVAPIANELEAAYYDVPSRLDRYFDKDVNPNYPNLPWEKREGDPDYRNDFWLHHLLVTRTEIYRREVPIVQDFLIEIADRRFVFMDVFRLAAHAKVVKDIHYSAEPMLEIFDWERGAEAEVVPSYYEAKTMEGAEGRRENLRIHAKYMNAYIGAVGRVRINISLAIRNALDAIHDRRIEQGLITPEIERRDDSPVPSTDLP